MKAALFLREIRIEHTLFALPFAYVGALIAAGGLPPWPVLGWITLAVLGARTAAMAANRYFDRDIDARNPRTARRALASGTLSPLSMLAAIVAGLAVLLWAAWMLNPLCVKLLPIAGLGVLLYPLCKRVTWVTHFVLGAVDGLAPLGAYIGVAGRVSWPALLLFAAVTVWVAGFDIVYALMDLPVDRAQGIQSLPARFGEGSGRALPIALHVAMVALLALAGVAAHAAPLYYAGVAAAAALVLYEDRLLHAAESLFVLNERVFVANMAFSVVFLATTLVSYTRATGAQA
jgi:4-hydroxybenzoate polyprenyltransferase